MCNLSQGIREHYLEQGIKEGIKQGLEQVIKQGIEEGIKKGIEEGIKKGIEEGIKKGIEQGIINSIQLLATVGTEKDMIKSLIMEEYNLSTTQTEQYVEKYYD